MYCRCSELLDCEKKTPKHTFDNKNKETNENIYFGLFFKVTKKTKFFTTCIKFTAKIKQIWIDLKRNPVISTNYGYLYTHWRILQTLTTLNLKCKSELWRHNNLSNVNGKYLVLNYMSKYLLFNDLISEMQIINNQVSHMDYSNTGSIAFRRLELNWKPKLKTKTIKYLMVENFFV